MKALIDGDVLVYRCGFAAQHTWYEVYEKVNEHLGWCAKFAYKKDALKYVEQNNKDDYIIKTDITIEPLSHAITNVNNVLQSIMTNTGADSHTIFLSGKDNYREKIATILPYKGNRDPTHKPVYYEDIRNYLTSKCGALIVDGMEADDALGIEQIEGMYNLDPETQDQPSNNKNTIICTIDKDLTMIPGHHYNLDSKKITFVSEIDGYRNFFRQVLKGDSSDNIPGLFKLVGIKCTRDILEPLVYMESVREMRAYVEEVYLIHRGFNSSEAMMQKVEEVMKLLWISRTYPNDIKEFIK